MARLVDAAQQLTDQRTQRLFVGSFSGQLDATDQSTAGQDDGTGTPTGQYQTRGQYGYAVEGQPVSQSQQASQKKGPGARFIVLGVAGLVAAYIFLRK